MPAKNKSEAQVVLSIDSSLDIPEEGYELSIGVDQVNIQSKDQAGLLYGVMSLEQLIQDARDQEVNLPQCEITDFPLLTYRAIHLDIKHHLEKKQYYFQLMDRLAKYKINAVILELEDKLKYQSQPLVGSEDAWTVAEWKALSEYAMERNIEISPLVQGLGHASFILKHDEYKHLRDDPESDWAFNPLDPETYEVQFDLYEEALEATPHGRYLHIGGDEVHTTGRGSDQSALELQLTWLNKVCKYAEAQGRTPIFWDDMPLKFAEVYRPMFDTEISKAEVDQIWEENESKLLEFIDQFPKNCIYMRWNYQSPDTYGNLKAMEWFTSKGFQVMGATAGQTRWVLMPQNQSNMPNIRSFALSSIEKGLDGLLLTLWDDDSPHFELYSRGILAFAEYSWSGDQRTLAETNEAFMHRFFGHKVEALAFIDMLEEPVARWKNLMVSDGSSRNDMVKNKNVVIELPDPGNKGAWSEKYADRLATSRELLQACDSVDKMIYQSKIQATRNRYTLEVYQQVSELIKYSAQMMLTLEAFDQPSELSDPTEQIKSLEELSTRFQEVRTRLENVYGQTRELTKPDNYILDQDHHRHSANQTKSFDWQFISELAMLDKINALVEQ
ncbi:MAG: family 20 glycosylhydrolase [Cyclobacteriaceae bacterium]